MNISSIAKRYKVNNINLGVEFYLYNNKQLYQVERIAVHNGYILNVQVEEYSTGQWKPIRKYNNYRLLQSL